MPRSSARQALISAAIALVSLAGYASGATADVARASDWLGHAVVTVDGQEVGTVRDLAIDQHGRITYVVVSVGSFLIENNLIAVAPDALVRIANEPGQLRLESDPEVLRQASRFATDGDWPARADVVRSTRTPAPPARAETAGVEPAPAVTPSPGGTATITSPTKTAHLSASERYITAKSPEPPPATVAPVPAAPPATTGPAGAPQTRFERLDRDRDGVLNRSEFAHEITPQDSYSRIDANANGVIDPAEFTAFEQVRNPAE